MRVARRLGAAVLSSVLAIACTHGGAAERAPLPPIQAERSPEGLARGRQIFEATCAACHQPPTAERAIGQRMNDLPALVGEFYAPNLTQHPTAGIAARTDAELARVIRYGVTHDGRRTLMGWAMSDADVAAVIGFLRSDAPEVAPDPTTQPPTRLSWLGRMAVPLVLGDPPELPPSGIQTPPQSDAVAYGRYLANAVYDCASCHSPGASPGDPDADRAYDGGFEFTDSEHRKVYSRNLTFHETGLKGWTRAQFRRALRDGISARGEPLRAPMRRYRGLPDEELDALFAFLQSLPPRETKVPKTHRPKRPLLADGAAASEPGGLSGSPAELFEALGCASCHRPGAQFHDRIVAAKGKSPEVLATWIRNPERVRPGTQMPTFEALIDEAQARALAEWVLAGNVERLARAEP